MKKLILLCATLFIGLSVWGTTDCSVDTAKHQRKTIIIKKNDVNPRNHRSPSMIPIEAYYDSFVSGIAVTFLHDLGEVDVNVTNHSTGECLDGTMSALAGMTILPISGTEGLYTVTFTFPDGPEYYGEFEL